MRLIESSRESTNSSQFIIILCNFSRPSFGKRVHSICSLLYIYIYWNTIILEHYNLFRTILKMVFHGITGRQYVFYIIPQADSSIDTTSLVEVWIIFTENIHCGKKAPESWIYLYLAFYKLSDISIGFCYRLVLGPKIKIV